MNKKETALLLGLVFTFVFSLCTDNIVTAQNIKDNTLRLHIIANSDTETDQQIKLAVRDHLLKQQQLLPTDNIDFETAVDTVQSNINDIENVLNNFLSENNISYTAKCNIEQFYFDTTQYDSFALPQGEYTALTVRLGQAEGKNWWCVIYPALCSQSCGEIVLQNSDEFIITDSITTRFKVVEIYEDIKACFAQRSQRYTKT